MKLFSSWRSLRWMTRLMLASATIGILVMSPGCWFKGMGDQWVNVYGYVVPGDTSTFTPTNERLVKPADGLDDVIVELWIGDPPFVNGKPTYYMAGSFVSESDGRFVLSHAGFHEACILKARKKGYLPIEQKIQFKEGEELKGIVTLKKRQE